MARSRTRNARLAVREARLITAELRRLGVPPRIIAKIWAVVVAVPVVVVLSYLLLHYDAGTSDSAVISEIQITYIDQYQSHVHNGSSITLKSLTLTCYPGGDAQPTTTTTALYPPLKPGYGEDAYVKSGCTVVRVNESHQLW